MFVRIFNFKFSETFVGPSGFVAAGGDGDFAVVVFVVVFEFIHNIGDVAHEVHAFAAAVGQVAVGSDFKGSTATP